MKKPIIGLVGTGIMGASMGKNLMKHGYKLIIYSRTREKAEKLEKKGAKWKKSPKKLAEKADIIITMVGFPKDVEEVYFGQEGILNGAKKGAILIDMTTTSPELAHRIDQKAQEKGLSFLDAPVTGGDIGAKKGTLTILCGGERKTFRKVLPVLRCMGTKIVYMGKAGSGQHTKMANQIAIAGALSGASEAMAYAKRVGLSPKAVLSAISEGAAASTQLSAVVSKAVNDDLSPGFFMKHFVKDMRIAKEESDNRNLHLDVLTEVLGICEDLIEGGMEELGTQAILEHYK